MTTGADVIARRLAEAGCRHAFGIPGGEVLAMMEALDAAGIAFHLAKHENAGGFMAEGTWHATGAPGILLATIGPGAANAVNVAANALQDRVPLILITGMVDPADQLTYTHQVFDHQAVFRPVVKASFRAERDAVAPMIEKALAIALEGRPGPIHIDLPIAIAEGPERAGPPIRYAPPAPVGPAEGPAIEEARRWLATAERPLAIAGVDVLTQGAEEAVRRFAEDLGIPLLTTYKAKGVLDEEHPLALGGAGLSPKADDLLLPLVRQSDCILLAGYDPIEMRAGWRAPWPAGHRVIELTAAPNTHFVHQAAITFVGDVAAGLEALARDLAPRPRWPDGETGAVREQLAQAFAPGDAWGPGLVFETVRRLCPPETVATADSGAHRILLSQMWRCPRSRGLLQSTGLCTMGCALPLAISYALAQSRPAPVVAFTGDAGLEMVLGELATARELSTPVIVVVLADRSLALIEKKQRAVQRPNLGVDFTATDFAAVAEAMGGAGVTVRDSTGLEAALGDALARRDRFTVIAAEIDRRAYDGTF